MAVQAPAGGATVLEAGRALVAGLAARSDELVERTAQGVIDRLRDLDIDWDPAFGAGLRRSIEASFAAGITAATHGASWQDLPPQEPVRRARMAARIGIPLELLLRGYRAGHEAAWECVLEESERLGLPDGLRTELLALASRVQFAYIDHLMDVVTAEYTRSLTGVARGREQRRLHLVIEVLGGRSEGGEDLGYRLQQTHVALIVHGKDAEVFAHALGAELGGECLAVSDGDRGCRAWLGRCAGFTARDWSQMRNFPRPDAMVLACGDAAEGPAGFRLTHGQATMALAIAKRRPGRLVSYSEVGHLALLLQDEPAARRLIEACLDPLEPSSARGGVLLETLRSYIVAQQSVTCAAAALGVHAKTVSYRLRKIEDRVGYPVAARRAQLEIALELLDILDRS
jgi:hypothetical protein